MPNLDEMFGPELVYEEPGFSCAICQGRADLVLVSLGLSVRTKRGKTMMYESTPEPDNRITICKEHNTADTNEYVATGCHLSLIQSTNVETELVGYRLEWEDL